MLWLIRNRVKIGYFKLGLVRFENMKLGYMRGSQPFGACVPRNDNIIPLHTP
jgi:hypothetical protein